MKKYDVIVLGSDPNGLTAAFFLAKKGLQVLLLEARPSWGGLTEEEEFHPGYFTAGLLEETHRVSSQVIHELGLSQFGLKEADPNKIPPQFLFDPNGPGLFISSDLKKTIKSIQSYSPKDANAWGAYLHFMEKAQGLIQKFSSRRPPKLLNPSLGDSLSLARNALALRTMDPSFMMEWIRSAPTPLSDWLGDQFETDLLKAGLASQGLFASTHAPLSPFGTALLFSHFTLASTAIDGGTPALIRSLITGAQHHGVSLRSKSKVQALLVSSGKVNGVRLTSGEEIGAGVVLSALCPIHTFVDLFPPRCLFEKALLNMENF